METPSAFKIPAHSVVLCGIVSCTISADESVHSPFLLLDSVPVPNACRGLQIITLTMNLSLNK